MTKPAFLTLALLAAFAPAAWAETAPSLDDLSLEDLVRTDITSVSRKSQSLADVAAAAFVISADDIRRSGARALPDVLRMAPGIEVAQIDNGRYAVTARGFNGRFANKLQVLIDGRSIYHPVFSGVMWELDPVPLEDIERIEIIRGPGAVMWGANAVNGVINIITKHSREQAGGAATVGAGTGGTANLYARYGQKVDGNTSWKVSLQGRYAEPGDQLSNDQSANDRLRNFVLDFRLDHDLDSGRDLSIWGNASQSRLADLWLVNPVIGPGSLSFANLAINQVLHSESLMGRYRWLSDSGIESSIQVSGTHSGIEISNFYLETRNTLDLDYQGRYSVGHHDLLWGATHRSTRDEVTTDGTYISINHPSYTHSTTGLFLHDDWTLIRETLTLGLGARLDNTSRNGNNWSINTSLLWTPTRTDSLWAKYARAPRTAARAEQDISVFAGASFQGLPVFLRSNPNPNGIGAEKIEGVEIGYRKQFTPALGADLTLYRYRYSDLRSGVPYAGSLDYSYFPSFLIQNIQLINGQAGWSNGAEFSADWMVTANWRLQLSYTWSQLAMDRSSNPSINEDALAFERAVPHHRVSLRSQWNIDNRQQFDAWIRSSSGFERLSAPWVDVYTHVPGYVTLDLRYGYKVTKDLELALIGRNLIGARRTEYVSDYIPSVAHEIVPTGMVTAHWKF